MTAPLLILCGSKGDCILPAPVLVHYACQTPEVNKINMLVRDYCYDPEIIHRNMAKNTNQREISRAG
jgi:hypothetical protein